MTAIDHLRALCEHGIGLNECDLAAAVPALLDVAEAQKEYIAFLGERLNAHEGLAWARYGQDPDPRHVIEGIRLRDAIADAEARLLPQGEPE